MRKRRKFVEGAAYHVGSRTNNKINVFSTDFGRIILLYAIETAKEKFGFRLHNFCIMPNHFHLLISPQDGTNLSRIVQWIKTYSAKRWNRFNNFKDHLWGERFFARPITNMEEYAAVSDYIDQNPVKAGLVKNAQEWEASGAYYIANGLSGLVDR